MTWRPFRHPEEDAKPVASALDTLTKKLGIPSASTMSIIKGNWEQALGETAFAHAVPVSLHEGVLLVEVENAAWRTELKWMSGQIADRLNVKLGGNIVERLEFRVSRGARNSNRSD